MTASSVPTILLVLVLVALPVMSLAVALAPPLLLQVRGRFSTIPFVLWLTALGLLATWVVVQERAGVRADEEGTGGSILDPAQMVWWYASMVVGAAAIATAMRTPADGPRTGEALGVLAALIAFICAGLLVLGPLIILLLPVALFWAFKHLGGRRRRPA